MALSYRTYDQLHADIQRWEPHLPLFSAVAGIPRSGVAPAAMLAMLRHVPLVTLDSVLSGETIYRPSVSRSLNTVSGPILVLDDTCNLGRTKREVRQKLAGRDVILGAVYASDKAIKERAVDVAGYRIATPYHTFAWNLFRDSVTSTLLTDMDGVLCEDWHGGPMNERTRPAYERWLETVQPLAPVTQPLHGIVTARMERNRPQTVAWLERHGIRFKHLIMHPDTATRWDSVGHKAAAYRRLAMKTSGFVESCPIQSAAIAKATGFPVLCYATGLLHNPTHMPPRWK